MRYPVGMFYAENVLKSFDGNEILSSVSFSIGDNEKVGLVGANGSGKSTLLSILAGEQFTDNGNAGFRGNEIGFLKQETITSSEKTISEELWESFPEASEIEYRLQQLSIEMSKDSENLDSLITEQAKLFERFEQLDGYRIDKRIGRTLAGLGFQNDALSQTCGSFSGGWQMRIGLAKILVRRPDNLILDEPTNHLDQNSQNWLAEELTTYPGTVLLVTHDGEFHDRVVNKVFELRNVKINAYSGNYTSYQKQKAERLAVQSSALKRQEKEISKQEKFIERFRSKATKASQVRSREKALNKIMPLEKITSDLEVSFKFDTATRTERDVLKAQNIGHSYNGNEIVLIDANLQVERGDKVMFIGPNGGGKSTLLKKLAGEITPTHGDIFWANRADLGYYDQHQDEALDYDLTVLEEVQTVNKEHGDGVLRNILGNFLFRGDDVFKSVSVLSGGDRSRLALAKFLIKPGNVVLLDAPTNHLDRTTQRKLISALENYEGTIICASHDRELLEKVATRVIKVNDGECIELNNWHNISEVLTSN